MSVTANVTQGGTAVPAAWPVSVAWSASPRVHVGPRAGLRPYHIGWLDPVAGTFTALRPYGAAVLSATVNGETAHAGLRFAPG